MDGGVVTRDGGDYPLALSFQPPSRPIGGSPVSTQTAAASKTLTKMDLASSEYIQSFEFRLRGREKSLLSKLDLALKKIEDGSFGVCEICEEPIGKKRLEARPETTLCIKCKEDQEREER